MNASAINNNKQLKTFLSNNASCIKMEYDYLEIRVPFSSFRKNYKGVNRYALTLEFEFREEETLAIIYYAAKKDQVHKIRRYLDKGIFNKLWSDDSASPNARIKLSNDYLSANLYSFLRQTITDLVSTDLIKRYPNEKELALIINSVNYFYQHRTF